MDHAELFLKSLSDPSKFRVVPGVPVFRPHERHLPPYKAKDGSEWPEVRIKVTPADLPEIAARTERAGPQVMTEGHRNLDPNFPEAKQPRKVGWEINHRPGQYVFDSRKGPEPCILADLCYELPLWNECGPSRYPFRSADYDFSEKRLSGLAVLIRRPFLELGMIPYQTHSRTIAQYALETPTPADGAEWTPEEEAQYAKMCRYMAKKHPKLAAYMDGAATPEPTPAPPGNAQYAAQVTALEQRLATEQAERLLDKVTGKIKFDRTKELATLTALPDGQRPAHVQYMLDNYSRLATGTDTIKLVANPPADAKPGELSKKQMEAAVQYSASAKVPWEAARTWALANIPAA